MERTNHFGVVDYIAVGGTLLFSLCIGLYYGFFGKQTKEEMLVGGRNMKALPVAMSMLVTYFSAISILGYPAEVYAYGIQLYLMTILGLIFVPLSTLIYVKVFYNMKLTSIYEYLEYRFDSIWVRWLTSFTFILQVLLVSAVVLFAPAIALEAILGLPIWLSITGIGVIGSIYTAVGGIKAVIWTDVFQFVMIMVGMFAIVTKGFISAGGFGEAFRIASERGRLVLFDFTVDPYMRHNFWNFFLGYGFACMSLFGTHQPLVQRYCSLPTYRTAVKSLLMTIPLNVFVMTIVLFTGISVTATYAGCCPILLGHINRPDAIIPYFVIKELAFIPGMMGIFVSCIFSAVLSSVSSSLNSLAAVTWEDFVSKIKFFKTMKASGQAQWTKIIAAAYGALCIGFAFGAQNLGGIFQLVMTAVGATSGPLGGIFLCGLFIPFMNKHGAIVGMLAGLASMMILAVQSYRLGSRYVLHPRLPTDLDECPDGTDFSNAKNFTTPDVPDFEYPERLYTLSYILYSFVGAVVTTVVAVLVSMVSGGLSENQKVEKKYIHPWIWEFSCVKRFLREEDKELGGGISNGHNPSFKRESEKTPNSQYPYEYEPVEEHELNNKTS